MNCSPSLAEGPNREYIPARMKPGSSPPRLQSLRGGAHLFFVGHHGRANTTLSIGRTTSQTKAVGIQSFVPCSQKRRNAPRMQDSSQDAAAVRGSSWTAGTASDDLTEQLPPSFSSARLGSSADQYGIDAARCSRQKGPERCRIQSHAASGSARVSPRPFSSHSSA
jgi:hypothetical protein